MDEGQPNLKGSSEELQRIIGTISGRITEFVNELLSYDKEIKMKNTKLEAQLQVQIERSEMDNRKIDELKGRVAELTEQLEESKRSEYKANQSAKELGEATKRLSDWNKQLETRLNAANNESNLVKLNQELEAQLLGATEKRITIQSDYSKLEEELARTKRLCKEQEDIQAKLCQENSILKSKLYSSRSRSRSKGRLSKNAKTSSPSPLISRFDELDLSDIFKSSFPSR